MNFLLADGSTYNTLTGNDAWDGDYAGVLVADPLPDGRYGPTHDNTTRTTTSTAMARRAPRSKRGSYRRSWAASSC